MRVAVESKPQAAFSASRAAIDAQAEAEVSQPRLAARAAEPDAGDARAGVPGDEQQRRRRRAHRPRQLLVDPEEGEDPEADERRAVARISATHRPAAATASAARLSLVRNGVYSRTDAA